MPENQDHIPLSGIWLWRGSALFVMAFWIWASGWGIPVLARWIAACQA